MIRKQIYLDQRHNDLIRKLATARGVSEAEVIREAIDTHAGRRMPRTVLDPQAWARAMKLMRSLRAARTRARNTRKWHRAELYDERLKRYASRTR